MTIQEFNPSWYFRDRLIDDDIKKINTTFTSFIENDDNFHNPPQWGANVKSSFYHPNNKNSKWDLFLDIVRPFADRFISLMKPKMGVEVYPQEGWINKYSWQYFQEYHTHASPDINLSMVYFYRVKKDDECFKFVVDNTLYSSNGYNKMFQIPNKPVSVPKVNSGDLIFFPSFYPHFVTPHFFRGFERVTFSANFLIVPAQ